jgi:hypothetical protein
MSLRADEFDSDPVRSTWIKLFDTSFEISRCSILRTIASTS